ncbi:MAG: glycosyltransferase family 4 protein [Bacteroidales bacterium]|nr:glycosyltransferase family 4 protein [Bacteroidales bacterium]
MKLLIVAPSSKLTGGVSFHYKGLQPHWTSEVRYARYGKRPGVPAALCLLPDLLAYIWQLIFFRPDVVVVNPSFRPYQLVRDGVYLLLAKAFGRKVVTWFHGWDGTFAERCIASPNMVRRVYGKCSFIYVLSSDFRKQFQSMGIDVPVLLGSTVVDDALLEGFDANERVGEVNNLLYLARIDRAKGIYEAIDAFALAKKSLPELTFTICGSSEDAAAVNDVKAYVERIGLGDCVLFQGAVYGERKRQAYAAGDIYILPSYGEGMATSVLEAMAFGLPVISTPYGGIKDFFTNGEMGFLIPSHRPEDIATKIVWLATHPEACHRISRNNSAYAAQHFLASKVAAKFESDLREHCIMPQIPRVVSVYPYFSNVGGAQNVTIQLARHLNTEKPIVLIETSCAQVPAQYAEGVRYEQLSWRTVLRLADRRTVFISHHRKTTLKLLLWQFLLLRQIKVIHVAHSVFNNLRWICLFPKHNVAVSETVKRNLVGFFHVPEQHVHVIYNGIPDCSASALQSRPSKEIKVLHIGRICSVKRQVALAEALRGRLPQHIQLHFAGDGPDAMQLKAAVEKDRQMKYLGYVPTHDLLEHYDYLLLFSEQEGLGLTLLEACRAGVPMITNDIPSVLEVNEDHRTGYVFRSFDDLAAGIGSLPKPCDEAYATLSKAARAKYEELFREEHMIAQYKAVIHTVYGNEKD